MQYIKKEEIMAKEGTDDGGKIPVVEIEEVKPDASGKYPETIPWSKYVGIKESLGKKLTSSEEKVKNLEEQLKKAPNADEFNQIKGELESTKTKLTEKEGELTKTKEATVTELRKNLIAKGLTEERVKTMSEAELKVALEVLGDKKPLPDLGGGGGSGVLQGSPMELAKQAYESSNKFKK